MREGRVLQDRRAAIPWTSRVGNSAGLGFRPARPSWPELPISGDGSSVYQVRSAARSIEVLEYFRLVQRPSRAKDIGLALGLSPSSTSDLLKTLVEIGYLRFDGRSKLYFVGPRAVLFANWLSNQEPGFSELVGLTTRLSECSGECVVVAAQRGCRIQFLTVLHGPEPTPPEVAEGLTAPLIGTAAGMAILMRSNGADLTDVVRRITKVRACQALVDSISDQLEECRRQGYASDPDAGVLPDYRRIAVPLCPERLGVPIAVGIGGPKDRIRMREPELIGMIRATMKDLLG